VVSISELLGRVSQTADCSISAPTPVPVVPPRGLALPDDLAEFYQLCGGLSLFASSAYAVEILPPDMVVPANIAILGEEFPDDRSSQWVTVAALPNGDFISLDLDRDRLGRCYDSSHEVHGVVGSCAIVANSFSQLLESFLNANGGYWFWLEEDFSYLGDAYD
jgi:antitoxin YokJ